MKTVRAPGAPWPTKWEVDKPKAAPKPKPPRVRKPKPKPMEVDFFKEAREQIASGRARGAMRKGGNRNAVSPRNSVHGA